MTKKLEKELKGIWYQYKNLNKMSTVSLEEIHISCLERDIKTLRIEEVNFGFNIKIPAIQITVDKNFKALLPRKELSEIEIYKSNILPFKKIEEFWHKVDWFPPVFMNMETIDKGFKAANIKVSNHDFFTKEQLQERFEDFFPHVYNLSNIIPITVQTLPESISISKHVPLIRESILAFYSGMRVTAAASLIPIIEDILGSIIENSPPKLDLKAKAEHSVARARKNIKFDHILGADWIPNEYIDLEVLKVMNERIEIIELIGDWLKNSFYEHTEDYNNISGFNRHVFAHAKSEIWQNPTNFFRAMGLIQALAFIECFAIRESKISIFAPIHDKRTESFHNDVIACLHAQTIKKSILLQLQTKNGLPSNATSSDDGWLLRSAILSSKMNDEIVKRLRDNGWQCHSFEEPIKVGEYITVEAFKKDKNIKVALLYCCDTNNEIYKKLEQTCDYILYLGPPYHQDSFAQGVKKYVGPLNAWLTPS